MTGINLCASVLLYLIAVRGQINEDLFHLSAVCPNTRVNYPVPVHHASTRPLGTKKLPVLNLEMLETSMMA